MDRGSLTSSACSPCSFMSSGPWGGQGTICVRRLPSCRGRSQAKGKMYLPLSDSNSCLKLCCWSLSRLLPCAAAWPAPVTAVARRRTLSSYSALCLRTSAKVTSAFCLFSGSNILDKSTGKIVRPGTFGGSTGMSSASPYRWAMMALSKGSSSSYPTRWRSGGAMRSAAARPELVSSAHIECTSQSSMGRNLSICALFAGVGAMPSRSKYRLKYSSCTALSMSCWLCPDKFAPLFKGITTSIARNMLASAINKPC
mmetsp:Transcript_60992/g.126272  ORF Transcript_60992/g.126272 Transcript_60992/m.126272 type:complete len:255 (-) Transcript_60992:2-766(-)